LILIEKGILLNIKEQILRCVSSSIDPRKMNFFSFSSASDDTTTEFLLLTTEFLKAKKYPEVEHRGRELILFTLTHHDKVPVLAPTLEHVNVKELYEPYGFNERRLHYCHQVNVFLLGLYIYHNFEPLRKAINLEMQRTTPKIKLEGVTIPFRYSGGTKYGEFLYRWRMAALCHDLGTGIQLCEGKNDKVVQHLERIPFQNRVSSLDELMKIGERDLLHELDTACEEVSLTEYMKYQDSNYGLTGGILENADKEGQ